MRDISVTSRKTERCEIVIEQDKEKNVTIDNIPRNYFNGTIGTDESVEIEMKMINM